MTEIVAAHLERVARELAHKVAREVMGTDEYESEESLASLSRLLAAALAACAREEHKATCIICSVKREPCPRLAALAALERAAGEKA